MNVLFGKKLGMTRFFAEDGKAIPVTLVEAGPNVVVQVKGADNDGYNALQIGFGSQSEKRVNKPLTGHYKTAGVSPARLLREVRVETLEDIAKPGHSFKADLLVVGELVDVTAISKGLGFQGTIRRHGFATGPRTHGQSDRWRSPGSIGQSASPSRVFKGMKMAGRMGGRKTTVKNLQVVMVDAENNVIALRGAVPGRKNSLVKIRKK